MNVRSYEFKAKVNELGNFEEKLKQLNPRYVGEDVQIDTYFKVNKGRLKLREGNVENALINYDRENKAGSKLSDVKLYKHPNDPALKDILMHQLGVKVIVSKKRRIYFLENVKFHFDIVEELGYFIEVEALDSTNEIDINELEKQCNHYFKYFGLKNSDLIDQSYSDLLLNKTKK